MPVRDLTERPNIPRLGKIRLGLKDEQRGFPKNVDYFVCPEEVQAVYGEKPTELRIVFLADDLERIASQYYRAYNASSGLICRGDGYNADALLDGDELKKSGGELTVNAWAHGATRGASSAATTNFIRQQIPCAGAGYDGNPACPMFATKKCAVRNFMQFAIRDVPGLGVYQMDTGSVINIKNINGTIEMARMMFGGVAGVPMILRRSKLEVAPEGKKTTVNGVELIVDTQYSLANLLELRKGSPAAALLPPVDETEAYLAIGDGEEEVQHEYPQERGSAATPAGEDEASSAESHDSLTTSPAASPEQQEAVSRLVLACKGDWAPRDYLSLFKELNHDYMPEGERGFDVKKLTASGANRIIADLKQRRGEPAFA